MSLVVDASVCIALLVDSGSDGRWAEQLYKQHALVAPQLLLPESSNVLRRLAASRQLADLDASTAFRDLLRMSISLYPFEPVAERVWSLRGNLSSYDACYVALAESLDVPLATLDRRLAKAPGPRCAFVTT